MSKKIYIKNPNSKIAYDWWKYVSVSLIAIVIWYYAFYMTDKLKNNEKIQIFTTSMVKDFAIEKELEETFISQGILDYFFYQAPMKDSKNNTILEIQGFQNSDILLLSESIIKDSYSINFVELNEDIELKIKYINDTISFYQINSQNYGVKIYDGLNSNYCLNEVFSKWFDLNETSYLFISSNSYNIGEFNTKSKVTDRNAIDTFFYLLGGNENHEKK